MHLQINTIKNCFNYLVIYNSFLADRMANSVDPDQTAPSGFKSVSIL